MPPILSKHCILTGDLDSYCLVCTTHLPGVEDVLAHVRDSEHNALLERAGYYEKFKDDLIRKVNCIYFCELCNMTLSTAAKVGIHVTEEAHIEGKRRQLKRVGNSIVFQKNTLIEEGAWNGLVDQTCVLCNIEFDDYTSHISEHSHVLNVIRNTVTIDNKNNIYRKVDGGYHCLTCNKIVSDNFVTEHFNSLEHDGAVTKYDVSRNDVSNDGRPESKAADTQPGTGNQYSNTDRKTSNSGPVLMKGKEKPVPSKSVTKELEAFAKEHGLSVNNDNYTVHCNVCSLKIPASLNCVKEHVNGKKHKDISLKQKQHKDSSLKHSDAIQPITNNIKRLKADDFIVKLFKVDIMNKSYVVINDQILLKTPFFCGISAIPGKFICQFCHIDLTVNTLDKHLRNAPHTDMMNNYVITSLEDEFVRQVKSDLYHCGYCGEVESEYDDILDHLATAGHKQQRTESEEMLRRIKIRDFFNFNRFL